MMKFDNFTIKVQEALVAAQSLARNNDNQQIGPVHLLIALIEQQDGITIPLLQKLGTNIQQIKSELKYELDWIPKVKGPGATDIVLSRSTSELFDVAWKEAELMKDQYLSTEHLLMAMTKKDSLLISSITINKTDI